MLEIEKTISQMKISCAGIIGKLNTAKYRSVEIIQTETQKEKKRVGRGTRLQYMRSEGYRMAYSTYNWSPTENNFQNSKRNKDFFR